MSETEVTVVSTNNDALPTDQESLKDRLRRQRQEQAENKFHDLDIPGYNGEMFIRYRLLESTELDSISQKVRQETRNRSDRVLLSALDSLIMSCEEVWVRENGKEIPLRQYEEYEGSKEVPVRFNIELAEFLAFTDMLPDPPTARSVVLAMFGGNDIAAQAHSAANAQWMMRAGAEVDMLLGEV